MTDSEKQQTLIRIEKLQQTRDYADEVESVRLTKIIDRLQREVDGHGSPTAKSSVSEVQRHFV